MKKKPSHTPEQMKDSEYEKRCPLIRAVDVIGGKWKLPVIWYLTQAESLGLERPGNRMLTPEVTDRIGGMTPEALVSQVRAVSGLSGGRERAK